MVVLERIVPRKVWMRALKTHQANIFAWAKEYVRARGFRFSRPYNDSEHVTCFFNQRGDWVHRMTIREETKRRRRRS